jgi:hypothetical protein
MKKTTYFIAALLTIFSTVFLYSCQHKAYVLPVSLRTGDPTICFERDILPIFQSNCAKGGCHDAGSGKSGYVLDNYQDIVRNGIVAGNPAASKIWQSVAIKILGVTAMPQGAPGLSPTDLDLIKRWIATGAIDSGACSTSNCDTTNFSYSSAIAPIMQTYCVGCHSSSSSNGGRLASYTDVMHAAVNGTLVGDVAHVPGHNAMPLGGNMLQDCQITQIKKWVGAGAPNN